MPLNLRSKRLSPRSIPRHRSDVIRVDGPPRAIGVARAHVNRVNHDKNHLETDTEFKLKKVMTF